MQNHFVHRGRRIAVVVQPQAVQQRVVQRGRSVELVGDLTRARLGQRDRDTTFICPDVPGAGSGGAGLAVDVVSKSTGEILSGIKRIVFSSILEVKIFTARGQIGKNHPVAGAGIGIVSGGAVGQRAGGCAVRGDVVAGAAIEGTNIVTGRMCHSYGVLENDRASCVPMESVSTIVVCCTVITRGRDIVEIETSTTVIIGDCIPHRQVELSTSVARP